MYKYIVLAIICIAFGLLFAPVDTNVQWAAKNPREYVCIGRWMSTSIAFLIMDLVCDLTRMHKQVIQGLQLVYVLTMTMLFISFYID